MPKRLKKDTLTQQRQTLADTQECMGPSHSTLDANTSQDTRIVDSSLHTIATENTLMNPAPSIYTSTSLTHIDTPVRRQGQTMTDEERTTAKRVFLEEFGKQANVTSACSVAGIHRTLVYQWLEQDTDFALAWNTAEQQANDVLRRAAYDRGVHGVSEPVVSMGKLVRDETTGEPLTVKKYSDLILLTLMRARMPEYRDSKHVDINQNTNIHMTQHSLTLDLRGMNADELAQVRAIAEGMKQREQARLEQGNKDKSTGEHTIDA